MRRGDDKRAKILDAALALFRKKGFAETSMRDVAKAAGVALGAAYYYFPSKDAIVLAYYDRTQNEHAAEVRAVFAETDDLRARLGACFHGKIELLARDRKLLSGLFRSIADPTAPVSIFGDAAKRVRDDSIALFDEALGGLPLDAAARRVLVLALWSLHMGLMLFFVHDSSKKQEKTRRLVDRALDFVVRILPIAPELAPVFGADVASMLAEAGLL